MCQSHPCKLATCIELSGCACVWVTGAETELSNRSKLFSAPISDALQLLQSWVTQPVLPVLKLSAGESTSPMLIQSRCYDWGQNTAGDPFANANDSSWFVPMAVGRLGFSGGAGDADMAWVEVSNQSQVIDSLGTMSATDLILNAGGSGYFR